MHHVIGIDVVKKSSVLLYVQAEDEAGGWAKKLRSFLDKYLTLLWRQSAANKDTLVDTEHSGVEESPPFFEDVDPLLGSARKRVFLITVHDRYDKRRFWSIPFQLLFYILLRVVGICVGRLKRPCA
jgi:hypothetical protein